MDVFYGFDSLREIVNPVVTIGSYDGVHAGHKEILRCVKDIAKEINGESVVITFSPHPREVLFGVKQKLLNTLDEKTIILERQGVDVLIVVPFTIEFGDVEPYDFVKEYLVAKVGVCKLVIGYDHHFGKKNRGDIELLRSLQGEFNFEVIQIPQYNVDSCKVSSTIVREALANGNMSDVNRYIGYQYFICGDLLAIGEVSIQNESKLLPPAGIYDIIADYLDENVKRQLTVTERGVLMIPDMDCKDPKSKIIITFI